MEIRDFNDISWLGNPFNDLSVYGTRFSIRPDSFSWRFYMNSKTKKRARRLGFGLVSYLKELYKGLDGTVRVKSIGTTHLQKKRPYLYELILPNPPYLNNQIPLVQKIINLAGFNNEHKIDVYIFWKFKVIYVVFF